MKKKTTKPINKSKPKPTESSTKVSTEKPSKPPKTKVSDTNNDETKPKKTSESTEKTKKTSESTEKTKKTSESTGKTKKTSESKKETTNKSLKPAEFSISGFLSSFEEIPSGYSTGKDSKSKDKIELNVSNCSISNWNGINKHQKVSNLDISGTYIANFKNCCDLPKLTTLNFENTPLSASPFAHISALYALNFQLKHINNKEVEKGLVTALQKHPLAADLTKMMREGYLISRFPDHDIKDINDLCYNGDGFVSAKRSIQLQESEDYVLHGKKLRTNYEPVKTKRTAADVINILNKFTLRPVQSATIAINYNQNEQQASKEEIINGLEQSLKAEKEKYNLIEQKFTSFLDNYKHPADTPTENLTEI